jgi:hypothetical protein
MPRDGSAAAPSEFTAVEDEPLSAEALQLIKARTMFQMVEEVPSSTAHGGSRRLLFLTNTQASVLAGSDGSVRKLLDALELPRPKLIINMLESQGFSEYTDAGAAWEGAKDGEDLGMVRGRGLHSFLFPLNLSTFRTHPRV